MFSVDELPVVGEGSTIGASVSCSCPFKELRIILVTCIEIHPLSEIVLLK